jgi:hypothetical protein
MRKLLIAIALTLFATGAYAQREGGGWITSPVGQGGTYSKPLDKPSCRAGFVVGPPQYPFRYTCVRKKAKR